MLTSPRSDIPVDLAVWLSQLWVVADLQVIGPHPIDSDFSDAELLSLLPRFFDFLNVAPPAYHLSS